MSGHQAGGRSILPLANRIVWLGGTAAGAVLLVLCAVVAQTAAPAKSTQARTSSPGAAPRRPAHAPRTSGPPVQPAQATPLEHMVRDVILRERSAIARRAFGGHAPAAPRVLLFRSDPARSWAFGSSILPPPEGVEAPPDASLFIAHHQGTGWRVAVTGSKDFTAFARSAPVTVVPKAERAFLTGYGRKAASRDTGLSFPWAPGRSWTMRPTRSTELVAFTGEDGRVLAAGPGHLYRLCSRAPGRGMLLLIHPNGFSSTYSQMSALTRVKDGSAVRRGDYLGTTGNEESCTGRHVGGAAAVVFGLLSGGRSVPLNSLCVGGWTLGVPASGAIRAERKGTRIEAGDPLPNIGAGAALGPAIPRPSQSATARPSVPVF
ncbi:peptidoglycan DD-metalloendopeptidase family protein [Actinomadura sp. WMMA1423]|uniref:peptidoglycan DD-metalloendopeptidase family protein n=1 Tax=Actinomadura sp. WMMA1423 TaxID=2591108 RepID=UPI001146E716|nr:peptidoglycan DD-metalloendopeptidase family protein [Actinomadura sp. WMMA1423]